VPPPRQELTPEEVRTSTLGLRADPSTEGSLQVNLPATAASIAAADLPASNAPSAQYTAKSSLIGYDNLGSEVTFDVYFAKSGANAWEASVYDRAAAAPGGGFPYAAGPLTSAALAFDGATGAFTAASPAGLAISVPNGATLALDLAGTSQLATDFVVRAAAVDGNAPAEVDRLEVGSDGTIVAVYENGARVPSYAIPLANVTSPNNLSALPGNVVLPNLDSGDIQIGTAGTGALGTIVSGALEQSTVDLATELTAMISAQRSYTANSKVFQTGAELIDVLVNLRR
jgi:flagellar hook protein FlgE